MQLRNVAHLADACRFIAADLYAFDFKLSHIAKHVLLPPVPNVPDQSHLPADEQLPPLLVINIQLPGYPVRKLPAPALPVHAEL